MLVDRRKFLGLSLAASAVGTAACQPGGIVTGAPRTPAVSSDAWSSVRDLFLLSRDKIHMAGLLLASHPTPVRDAIDRHRRALDEDPVTYLEEQGGRFEHAVREAAARYLGGAYDEVALTDSTTMGLSLLYTGLDLRAGQEILTTEHDHYVTRTSLDYAAARTGATIKRVALYEGSREASEDEMVARLAAAIGPRTRVVAVTYVHSGTGVRTPIARFAEAVRRANAASGRADDERALLCVDGVHGFGSTAPVIGQTGVDFFSAGCHKWMFGPRGTGVLWGKSSAWPAVRATIPPFDMRPGAPPPGSGARPPPPPLGRAITPGGFHSFEHRWSLAQAFELHERLGRENVAARIHALARQTKEGLATMSHVTLHTPMADASSAGLVCFEVAGMKPQEVVARLARQRIIASQTPYATSYARVTPALFNSPAEVDEVLRAVRGLAAA